MVTVSFLFNRLNILEVCLYYSGVLYMHVLDQLTDCALV